MPRHLRVAGAHSRRERDGRAAQPRNDGHGPGEGARSAAPTPRAAPRFGALTIGRRGVRQLEIPIQEHRALRSAVHGHRSTPFILAHTAPRVHAGQHPVGAASLEAPPGVPDSRWSTWKTSHRRPSGSVTQNFDCREQQQTVSSSTSTSKSAAWARPSATPMSSTVGTSMPWWPPRTTSSPPAAVSEVESGVLYKELRIVSKPPRGVSAQQCGVEAHRVVQPGHRQGNVYTVQSSHLRRDRSGDWPAKKGRDVDRILPA